MKVLNCVFRNNKIESNTEDEFRAEYKGYLIEISTDHGFGEPFDEYLTRFNIDVTNMGNDIKAVESYEDFETIKEAIEWALKGACLSNEKGKQ